MISEPAWLAPLRSWIASVGDGRICSVIGAGASLSSGAPTPRAFQQAVADLEGIPPEAVRQRGYDIWTGTVRSVFDRLLDKAAPHLGYRVLAELARTRPVTVVNLNWDPLANQAADLAGVTNSRHDIRDLDGHRPSGMDDPGLTVVHLHGKHDERPRYGLGETAAFPDQDQHLIHQFLDAPTLVLGVSLDDDVDVEAAFRDMTGDRREPSRVCLYRGNNDANDLVAIDRRFGPLIDVIQSDDTDFDRCLLVLADALLGGGWSDRVRILQPTYELAPVWDLAPASKEAFNRDDATVVICAETGSGMTTQAHLLAWAASRFGRFQTLHGPNACAASPHVNAGEVVVMTHPFGQHEPEDNPHVPATIGRLTAAGATVVVATRPGAVADLEVAAEPFHPEWEHRQLVDLARRHGTDHLITTGTDGVSSPGDVLSAGTGLDLGSVDDLTAALRSDEALAGEVMTVRLVALENGHCPAVAVSSPLGGLGMHYLTQYHYERETRSGMIETMDLVRIKDDPARAAADRLILGQSDAGLWRRRHPIGMALLHVLDAWSADPAAVASDPDLRLPLAAVAGDLLARRHDEVALEALAVAFLDAWALSDVAYEVVRLWPSLPSLAKDKLADAILAGPFGAYGMLEALLYHGTPAGTALLRAKVVTSLKTAAGDQAALAVDGMAWRALYPGRPADDREFLHVLTSLLDDPLAGGVRAFVGSYHAAGADRIGLSFTPPLDDAQAAAVEWLVKWHYLHQSHARGLLSRHPYHEEEKAWLCDATPHHRGSEAASERLVLVARACTNLGAPGWAFHVLANAAAVGLTVWENDGFTDAALDALQRASAGDEGVGSAIATYFSGLWPQELVDAVRTWLTDDAARDVFLDFQTGYGRELLGAAVTGPRFVHLNDRDQTREALGVSFTRLRGLAMSSADWGREAMGWLDRRDPASESDVELARAIAAGDLRDVEIALAAHGLDHNATTAGDVFDLAAEVIEERLRGSP